MTTAAPFFADLADGPPGGAAVWLTARDGTRLRAAHWPKGEKGTVFLLPGRTEYIEKYGRAAAELGKRGYGALVIDWRGQGLSQRALADPMAGHVVDFDEYQQDLAALVAFARQQDAPQPWYLLSHSMGGCIALRALYGTLPVQAAAFSAPMWGILIAPALRPIAVALASLARFSGMSHRYTPGTGPASYVATAPFAGNVLTRDADMWRWTKAQITAQPGLALGGPSLGWLHAALRECAALAALAAPDIPAYVALGSAEKVVDAAPIHQRMRTWAKGTLDIYQGAEHEVPIEMPADRARFYDRACTLFDRHR